MVVPGIAKKIYRHPSGKNLQRASRRFPYPLEVPENRQAFPFELPDPDDMEDETFQRSTTKGMLRVIGFDQGHGWCDRLPQPQIGPELEQ